MADFTNLGNLTALANLLNPVKDDSSDDDMVMITLVFLRTVYKWKVALSNIIKLSLKPESGPAAFSPGNIGSKKTKTDPPKESVYGGYLRL